MHVLSNGLGLANLEHDLKYPLFGSLLMGEWLKIYPKKSGYYWRRHTKTGKLEVLHMAVAIGGDRPSPRFDWWSIPIPEPQEDVRSQMA